MTCWLGRSSGLPRFSAALVALGLFDVAVTLLDSIGMTFGEVHISLLCLAKGGLALGVLLWLGLALSKAFDRRIKRSSSLTPSVQVLVVKIVKIALVTPAFLVAIGSLGVDLTTLTVFGGALGIGVGIRAAEGRFQSPEWGSCC